METANVKIVDCESLVKFLQYYSKGVYSSIRCSSTNLNHAMLVTGFGTHSGVEYYLVKNRYVYIHMYLF